MAFRRRRVPAKRPSTWQPLLYLRLIVLGLVLAYVIAFAIKNDEGIPIDYVFGTANVSLIWEMLLLLGIGLVAGILLSQGYRRRARRRLAEEEAAAAPPPPEPTPEEQPALGEAPPPREERSGPD